MEQFQPRYPDLYIPRFEDYLQVPEVYTTLPASNYPIYEEGVVYQLRDSSWTPEWVYDYDGQVLRAASQTSFRHYQNPQRPSAPVLLAFTGSYFNNQDHLTNQAFSESTFVQNYYNITNLAYYYNLFSPDIVIVDSADYTIQGQYFPQGLLLDGNTPEPYSSYRQLPTVELTDVFAPTVFSQNAVDAFGDMTASGPDVVGEYTVVVPDAAGVVSLSYDPESLVSNYLLTWAGPSLRAAYLQVGEKIYDCCLTASLIEVGVLTDELEQAGSVTLIAIVRDDYNDLAQMRLEISAFSLSQAS
jgi:hypothetical protein